MPPRKTLPLDRGFYFSQENYMDKAAQNIYGVVLYARSDSGIWYANGEQIEEKHVPGDLWRVQMVQR